MSNKILFVANIHKHFKAFHIPYIQYLKEIGFEVHVAANGGDTIIDEADKQYNVPISRNPFSFDNIKATKQLKQIIAKEQYCLVHCHTAMGSVTARIAAKNFRAKGLKVLYTVHGFHFYKGAPKKFWTLYYPMEKFLSRYTDGIITINKEDFDQIKNKNFKNKYSFLIPGIGINTTKLKSNRTIGEIRLENGYQKNDFLILYIAEFIPRKNHNFLLTCAKELKRLKVNSKILLAGRGQNLEFYKSEISKYGLEDIIKTLGFRKDIGEVIKMVNIGVSVSNQEGLPMNIAEEMYLEKPIIATKIRGHIDLIEDNYNGYLIDGEDVSSFVDYVIKLKTNPELYQLMGSNAKIKAKSFTLENSLEQMANIYKEFLPCKEEN